jgi:chitinase
MSNPKAPGLSFVRMLTAMFLLAGSFFAGTHFAREALSAAEASTSYWFAPYVDVTLPPFFDFQDPVANPNLNTVLAFVVASSGDHCTPTWGSAYGLDQAASDLDLDRRIVRVRQRGGDVVVSFGGVANDELASVCTDPAKLTAAYRSVIDRYDVTTIDLDLERGALESTALARRAAAIATLQGEAKAAGRKLNVWLTLPMSPDGLPVEAIAAVDGMLAAKVDLAGVNVMTMDYGASRPAAVDFVTASLAGIDATARQLTLSYQTVGVTFAPGRIYAKIGVTPMIGQNDDPTDRLDTDGAHRLLTEATNRGVSRFSMWSLNRDSQCGGNVDAAIVSNTCSGVQQTLLQFSNIFSVTSSPPTSVKAGVAEAAPAAAAMTPSTVVGAAPPAPIAAPTPTADTVDALAPAGPSDTSGGPYAEWRARREYDANARVVWRGMVYEAKWWNKLAQPDAPVAHAWDSPWRALGPVLASDTAPPAPPPLPDGTFPVWLPDKPYDKGDRVEHRGVGYRAKWWTRGEAPGADVDNPWDTSWEVIPFDEVPQPSTTTTTTATTNPKRG